MEGSLGATSVGDIERSEREHPDKGQPGGGSGAACAGGMGVRPLSRWLGISLKGPRQKGHRTLAAGWGWVLGGSECPAYPAALTLASPEVHSMAGWCLELRM